MPRGQPYVHLHVHSEYSILDGACRIGPLVARAAELEMPAIGLTDHGSMAGAVDLTRAATAAGLKPILGCEMYVVDDHAARLQKERRCHLTLIAETSEGYHNLVRLVSAGYLDGYWYRPRVDLDQLAAHSRGIIALSGCLSGRVCKSLLDGDERGARGELDRLVQIFGRDNVYVELQDGGIEVQTAINPTLAALARDAGLPLVGTGDVHYLTAADAVPHEALLCIQTGDTLDNPDRFKFQNHGFYLKSPEEMYALMAERWGEDMLRRTVEIAERCDARLDLDALHLPRFDVPDRRPAPEYLRELANQGLRERYGAETPELRERLDFELHTIEQTPNLPDYLLIVWDFIRFARQEGIPVGPGRGSAAGSLVAYCLRITDLDPMRYSLLFERFLNPGRKTLPDVDIDFAVAGRERVINYVAEKYGRRNVAQIITFGKMQPKAAIKDAGRVMGIPYGVVDRIAKLVPDGPKVSFEACMKPGAELRRGYDADETTRRIVDMAMPLEGVVRNDSIHAAAVVIGDRPLTEYLPLQQKGADSEVVTQFSMGDVEALGLLKMDFLGLRNLDVIERAIELIADTTGTRLDMDSLPLDDRRTYEMMARGDSTGVFQFESSGMREALRQVKPTEFEDLIALVALYRPGPMQFIPDYARNKADPSRIRYEDERLRPILDPTHGTCLTGDTLVVDARSGRRVRIDKIQPEGGFLVQGLDFNYEPTLARATHWFDNGERPVYELRLKNGASLRCTADHQFLTEHGWRELRDLQGGDFVATPASLVAPCEPQSLSARERDRYMVLAYLLADGSLSGGSVSFVSKDPALLADFERRCVAGFPGVRCSRRMQVRDVTRLTPVKDRTTASRYHDPSSLELWLQARDLRWSRSESRFGANRRGPTSSEKWIPEDVFGFADEDVARFLACMWDCDGYVSPRTVAYKTISHRLARDVATLLLRVGIRSVTHVSRYDVGGRVVTAYQVTTSGTSAFGRVVQPYMRTSKRDVNLIATDRSLTLDRPLVLAELYRATSDARPGPDDRVREGRISVRALERRYGFSRQHIYPQGASRVRIPTAIVDPLFDTLEMPFSRSRGNVAWVAIEDIVPAGTERVYDISVEGIHNFVANNIVVHNCIYQEQYMEIAKAVAGFSPAEADDLRKAIGKKIASLMASLEDKFVEGCVGNGVPSATARALWSKVEVAADYSFNKAHAACYALIAYRTAYLRANHPAEYMAALISSVMSTKDRVPFYVGECADMGVEVLPPDVNTSQADFAVVDGRIRFGLEAVKRVGEGAVKAIIAAREERPFDSLWDFCERVDMAVLNRGMVESLVACGALDSTGDTRRGMFEVLEQAITAGQKRQSDALVGQGSIFDLGDEGTNGAGPSGRGRPPIPPDEWPRDELLRREKEALGLYVSSHPLAPLRDQLRRKTDTPLRAIAELRDGQTVTVGGIIAQLRPTVTRRGDQMAFAELDDITASAEIVVFASLWETCRQLLQPDTVVLVKARADRRSDSEVKLIAVEVTPFEAVPDQGVVKLRVDARAVMAGIVDELKTLIGDYPGDAPVELEVQTSEGCKVLRFGAGYRVRPDGDFIAEARALLGEAVLA